MADTNRNYKIVPSDAECKTTLQRAQDLKQYLAANIGIATIDGNPSKAALFQRHLATLNTLIEHSRDRID